MTFPHIYKAELINQPTDKKNHILKSIITYNKQNIDFSE